MKCLFKILITSEFKLRCSIITMDNVEVPIYVKEPEDYSMNLEFKENDIELFANEETSNTISFIQTIFTSPFNFKNYTIQYQQNTYKLFGESLFAILINEFKTKISKGFIITETILIFEEPETNIASVERLWKGLDMLNLPHGYLYHDSLRKFKREYEEQNVQVQEILKRKMDYDNYKLKIKRSQNILFSQKENTSLQQKSSQFDISLLSSSYNPKSPHEIPIKLTTKQRQILKLYRIDDVCVNYIKQYLNTVEDFMSLSQSSKRFNKIMDSIKINPIELTQSNRVFFPNLRTLIVYKNDSELFLNDILIEERRFIDGRLINSNGKNELENEIIKENNSNDNNEINNEEYDQIQQYHLSQIILSTSLTRLQNKQFFGFSKLEYIDLPSNLKSIGIKCFAHCNSLRELSIPSTVSYIGHHAFHGCTSLTSLSIGPQWELYGNQLINITNKRLTTIEIPSSIKIFNNKEIIINEIQSIIIPEGTTAIQEFSFLNCSKLSSIELPRHFKLISMSVFNNSPLLRMKHYIPIPFLTKCQMIALEQQSHTQFYSVLFDSEVDDWSLNTSVFDSILLGKQHIAIVIHDTNGNDFGIYLHSQITHLMTNENNQWKGSRIQDHEAFLFYLQKDYLYTNEFYPIHFESRKSAFTLYKQHDSLLFSIGKNDIVVWKENNINECYCQQSDAFNYTNGNENEFDSTNHQHINEETNINENKEENTNIISHENQRKPFTIQRIQVYQMNPRYFFKPQTSQSPFASPIKHLSNGNNKKVSIEKKLDEQTEFLMKNEQRMISQIENCCNSTFQQVIFDSEYCNWEIQTSTFDQILFGKEQIVILIEQDNGNKFGAYIHTKINNYSRMENKEWKGIIDPNAIVFSLGTFLTSKYQIIPQHRQMAFFLYPKQNEILFRVGNTDIVIYKQFKSSHCSCDQYAFNYEEKENVFIGEETLFTVKRIQVYQMYQTEIQLKRMNEMKKKMYLQETEALKIITTIVPRKYPKEMKQLEEWTKLKFKEVIYNSSVGDWNIHTSTFDKRIFGKKNVVIEMEDESGITFGVFIKKKIDRYYDKNMIVFETRIEDSDAFVFIMKKHGNMIPMKFNILYEHSVNAFKLFNCENEILFMIGETDFTIMKENNKAICQCIPESFDYSQKGLNELQSLYKNKNFAIKTIKVFQMN